MDLAGYVALTRQAGLSREMRSVANNIANISTTGFRREGVIFAEEVKALPLEGGAVAMTSARARYTDEARGALERTDGTLDLAIEGDGFFTVMTPRGPRLTRAGAFGRDAEGQIVTPDGAPLLDEGGGAITIPFEAKTIGIAADGTVSADGQPLARLGVVTVEDRTKLFRESGTLFRADADPAPAAGAKVLQGFLEGSNVNPVLEIARMIEVQRAYEYGQKLMDQEDARVRLVVRTLGGQS
ncbi:flagellar hook-basal body complex protein [Amaricoccus solimangrovi]|uniref:Flagellar basal-body rod protein FlgF n=1 Tax=Amaricoccus solimangrovi TaxID=2589815 RepID=A0A501WYC6_9RHOB|nr:flagellar hook-basal body complex protein [Amaricoccus solimangrovi]TPE52497.1 flagellar hook-basal body complex protein [Amaricoccus solimangrovi]